MATVRVQEALFDLAAETAALTAGRTDVGAVASFLGVCRADDGLAAMVLEHYPAMTERALRRIAAEAEARWPLTGCTVIHRVGRILPGEPIVLVLTASTHRAAALESCAFLIDWLKTRAPFWKCEEFADGTRRWVEARADDEAAAARWGEQVAADAPGEGAPARRQREAEPAAE
ncbi:MAG: molybdenum cofactor biosynthesis protein MoaE [Acetobacteraceae bacterium]|nr:molybdenum cofactor biosynthesis protein MoaE [Acetobacteraceae bacterium]